MFAPPSPNMGNIVVMNGTIVNPVESFLRPYPEVKHRLRPADRLAAAVEGLGGDGVEPSFPAARHRISLLTGDFPALFTRSV